MNLEAAFDYLALENIDPDLAVIPSDVDDLTDEDGLNDKDTATFSSYHVPGTSADLNPPVKKQRK